MQPAGTQAAALMLGRPKDAAEDATAAAQLAAGSADGLRAHVRAGKAHLIMGHFDQVRASYVCPHALQGCRMLASWQGKMVLAAASMSARGIGPTQEATCYKSKRTRSNNVIGFSP